MEHKLYVGNLAPTANEYHVIKLFQQFGTIVREQFIWHKHGPKRGEPKGFCFVEFATKQARASLLRSLRSLSLCREARREASGERATLLTSSSSSSGGIQEAQTAKEKANGRLFLGRPLVVRFVDEKVLYSNDRLADDNAVVEAEKTRKQENERDKEHKRISDEAKIKAIQAKLALMKQETPSSSSSTSSTGAGSGKQPSSYSTRNTSHRDRPY